MSALEWDGMTQPYSPDYQASRDGFADAARDGDWPKVFETLDASPSMVNSWRPGGRAWYTPVHQAAWHGADVSVVRRLLTYDPWLTMRTARGDRALDIALRGGHPHLAALLLPVVRNPVPTDTLHALQRHLHDVIRGRVPELVAERELRLPELDVLTEVATPDMWFAVPGMYGGFHVVLKGAELDVSSWIRVVGGSGERHRITADGAELVEVGFV